MSNNKRRKKEEDKNQKRFFPVLFVKTLHFLGIQPLDIVREGGSKDVNTINSWKTRGAPQRNTDLDILITAINSIIKHRKLSFGSLCPTFDKCKQTVEDIFTEFSIDNKANIIADITKKPEELEYFIDKLLRYAYMYKSITQNVENSNKSPIPASEKNTYLNSKDEYRRLVVFDLDGTLIKGIKYSWTLLYESVGLSEELCKISMKKFKNGDITYPQWCKYDLDELQNGGLTKEIAQKAIKEKCKLTNNFRSAINMLKLNCAVGIISGGADIVLYSLIPDANELFDNNIFINKLIFDETDGKLTDIIPTPYDWDDNPKLKGVEGKHAALKILCKKYGLSIANSVFVGDDDNDFNAMKLAGMKILYHSLEPNDVTGLSRPIPEGTISVTEDNLIKVVDLILNTD